MHIFCMICISYEVKKNIKKYEYGVRRMILRTRMIYLMYG